MWLDEDTDAALEFERWRNSLCSGCHQPLSECTDIDGPVYDAEPIRCHSCMAREDEAKQFAGSDGASTSGLMWTVRPREEADG